MVLALRKKKSSVISTLSGADDKPGWDFQRHILPIFSLLSGSPIRRLIYTILRPITHETVDCLMIREHDRIIICSVEKYTVCSFERDIEIS